MGLYRQLAARGHEIFRDEDFAAACCRDNGRPSVPPSILALATLLQSNESISDQAVVERTRYDRRWKVARESTLELHVSAPSVEAARTSSGPTRRRSRPSSTGTWKTATGSWHWPRRPVA